MLASRADDRARLATLLGPGRVGLLRRGIERDLFDPGRRDRQWLAATLGIPPERKLVISVGRLDPIKNTLVLAQETKDKSPKAGALLKAGVAAVIPYRGLVRQPGFRAQAGDRRPEAVDYRQPAGDAEQIRQPRESAFPARPQGRAHCGLADRLAGAAAP